MNKRSRFIKVRVNEDEFKTLRTRADAQGISVSEHVRTTVTAVHQTLDVASELAALRNEVTQAPSAAEEPGQAGNEQREMLLLLRELAAARDAQILARVRAQLTARSGSPELRGGKA